MTLYASLSNDDREPSLSVHQDADQLNDNNPKLTLALVLKNNPQTFEWLVREYFAYDLLVGLFNRSKKVVSVIINRLESAQIISPEKIKLTCVGYSMPTSL